MIQAYYTAQYILVPFVWAKSLNSEAINIFTRVLNNIKVGI